MAGRPGVGRARSRGSIDELPSGALRVRVYAGVDPVTKKRHDLIEVIPPGPKAWAEADAARARLLQQIAERRNPRTSATVDELLTRYLDQFAGAPNTLDLYRTHVRNHIGPCLGHLRVGRLDAETLDSFYAELRRCRTRCSGRASIEHRVSGPHEYSSYKSAVQLHAVLDSLECAFTRSARWDDSGGAVAQASLRCDQTLSVALRTFGGTWPFPCCSARWGSCRSGSPGSATPPMSSRSGGG